MAADRRFIASRARKSFRKRPIIRAFRFDSFSLLCSCSTFPAEKPPFFFFVPQTRRKRNKAKIWNVRSHRNCLRYASALHSKEIYFFSRLFYSSLRYESLVMFARSSPKYNMIVLSSSFPTRGSLWTSNLCV